MSSCIHLQCQSGSRCPHILHTRTVHKHLPVCHSTSGWCNSGMSPGSGQGSNEDLQELHTRHHRSCRANKNQHRFGMLKLFLGHFHIFSILSVYNESWCNKQTIYSIYTKWWRLVVSLLPDTSTGRGFTLTEVDITDPDEEEEDDEDDDDVDGNEDGRILVLDVLLCSCTGCKCGTDLLSSVTLWPSWMWLLESTSV